MVKMVVPRCHLRVVTKGNFGMFWYPQSDTNGVLKDDTKAPINIAIGLLLMVTL